MGIRRKLIPIFISTILKMKNVLMICLGNICRSPLAEGILRDKIEKRNLNIKVDSAGTSNYHIGEHPDKRSVKNAQSHGIDISKLVARQFTVKDFEHFDKIYVMDSSNHNDILSLARNQSESKKVELILNTLYPGTNMLVPDPYFGGEQGFEDVFILLDKACDIIVSDLEKNYPSEK